MKEEKRCGTSEERAKNCFVEARGECRDCGSTFWFSCPTSWVCVKNDAARRTGNQPKRWTNLSGCPNDSPFHHAERGA